MKNSHSLLWIISWGLAIIVALLYNDWVFGTIFNPHLSSYRSLISELSALNQPHHFLFQLLDMAAGVMTIIFAIFIWRITEGFTTRQRWLLTGIFIFIGLDSIVDANLPISCAPSIDPHCSLLAFHSVKTDMHLIESNIAGAVIFLGPIAWWWHHRSRQMTIAWASMGFVIIQIFMGSLALIVKLKGNGDYGTIQRIYEIGLGFWMAILIGKSATSQLSVSSGEDLNIDTEQMDKIAGIGYNIEGNEPDILEG